MNTLFARGALLVALGLGALAAHAPPARAETRPACSSALVDPEATGVPAPVVGLAEARVRDQLAAAGCPAVDRATVTAMRQMLGLRGNLAPQQILQLGKSLLVRSILALELQGLKGQIALELSAYAPATGDAQHRSARVPADELLAKVVELAAELAPAEPAPASTPSVAAPAAPSNAAGGLGSDTAPPTVTPAAATPAAAPPANAPAAERAPAAPAVVGERSAAIPPVAPPTVGAGPAPAPTPAPAVTTPAAAPTPTPASAPPPLVVRRAPGPTRQVMAAVGLQTYYMFGQARGGPAFDFEFGSGTPNFHGSVLFRLYPGDATGYLFGGRLEGRPGWGRLRLVFGAELGLILVPGNDATVDMVLLGVEPLGVAIEWPHLRIAAKLLGADVYLVPAGQSVDGAVESIYGLSHGLSLAVF